MADPNVCLLARIAPEQKLRIARALQSDGAVVAMTGDGVNDAPALRQADIGVAMGASGTDVARETADLILLDDNFTHIVEAVEEGCAAFDNIRRFLTYHLTDNLAELTPFAFWALSAARIPLMISVLQVLALDIGTDLLPALALGAERPEPGPGRLGHPGVSTSTCSPAPRSPEPSGSSVRWRQCSRWRCCRSGPPWPSDGAGGQSLPRPRRISLSCPLWSFARF